MNEIILQGLDEKIYHYKTKTGLDIYIWPNEKVQSVLFSLGVKFGSVHTDFKIGSKTHKVPNGTAHFLEHVKFNIDKNTTAHDVYNSIGGDANAFTTFDYTCYTVFTTDKIKECLNTLLDFVYNPYFTKQMIAKEKGIIVEEAKMGMDNPYNDCYFSFLKQLLNKSKRVNVITGTPAEINRITLEDIELVYDTFYHPENMFLVVTGNVNPYEIAKIVEENLANKEFKEYKNPKIISKKEEKNVVKHFIEKEIKVANDKLKYAIKIPLSEFKGLKEIQVKLYASFLLSTVFGASSLFKEDLLEKELALNFMPMVEVIDKHLIVSFSSDTDYYEEVEKAIDNKINDISITKDELERKKKVKLASLILLYDDIENVNNSIQDDLIINGSIIDNIKEIVSNLNLEEMNSVINGIKKYKNNKAVFHIKAMKKDNE